MADLITFGETPLRFSPPGDQRLEMAREASIYADGTASNVAVAAADRGTDTLWLSKLPDTPLGHSVVTQLEGQGVKTSITWSDDPQYRQGLLFRESGSPPRRQKTWHDRRDTAVASATPGEFPIERLRNGAIVFTGLSMATLSEQAAGTTESLLRASASSGAVTAVDLDYSPGLGEPEQYREALGNVAVELDMLIASEDTVETALDQGGKPREVANILAAEYELDIVVITRSEHGAVALHNSPGSNVIHERETIETEEVDPSGQHAAFVGAFLQQLIEGSDPARALSHAVASAALARTIPGPFLTVDDEDVERVVERVVESSQ
jgi:2-dehydro-3-deoxygluconokinase